MTFYPSEERGRALESFLGSRRTCDWRRVVEKLSVRAPESFLGFCGTCDWGQGGGKTFWASESFLGYCGTCDGGQGGGKTFWAPGTCDGGQGGRKTFWASERFLGYCGTCDGGQGGRKTFWASENFLGYCGTRRVRTCDRGRGQIDMELSRKKLLQQWRVSSIASLDTLSWKVYNGPRKLWAALNVFLVGTCIYLSCHCLGRLVPFWFTLIISLKFKNIPRSWTELALNWFENNRSSKLFQSSKVFFQDGVANSVISTSLIRGYQPRHLGWRRYSLPRKIKTW